MKQKHQATGQHSTGPKPKPTPEAQRQFVAYLLAARTLWRHHRELVEAPEFPAQYRNALNQAGLPAEVDCGEYHCPSEERKVA